MIKKIAWNTFKQTGNIDTYLKLKQIQDIENNLQKVEQDGNNKNERNNNCRK